MMIVLILLLLTDQSYSSDQRCLLDGGGSTDTFFVREDSEVGAEVGRIRVNGRYHCINSINCIIITFYAGSLNFNATMFYQLKSLNLKATEYKSHLLSL